MKLGLKSQQISFSSIDMCSVGKNEWKREETSGLCYFCKENMYPPSYGRMKYQSDCSDAMLIVVVLSISNFCSET